MGSKKERLTLWLDEVQGAQMHVPLPPGFKTLGNRKPWKEESTLNPTDFRCHCFDFMRGKTS